MLKHLRTYSITSRFQLLWAPKLPAARTSGRSSAMPKEGVSANFPVRKFGQKSKVRYAAGVGPPKKIRIRSISVSGVLWYAKCDHFSLQLYRKCRMAINVTVPVTISSFSNKTVRLAPGKFAADVGSTLHADYEFFPIKKHQLRSRRLGKPYAPRKFRGQSPDTKNSRWMLS